MDVFTRYDPLFRKNLHNFAMLLVPEGVLDNLNVFASAILFTLVPYTPLNVIIFTLIFLVIYFTNLFNLGSKRVDYCRYNQHEVAYQRNLVACLKNTYFIYFIVAFLVNYNTFSVYKMQQFNVVG